MEDMKLYNYYSLDECLDRKSIIGTLKSLKKEGKIDYSLDGEILNIKDIDLEEGDIENLEDLFDENDVFPYLDKEDDYEGGYDEYGDYDDGYDDY